MLPTLSVAMDGDLATSYVQKAVSSDKHAAHSHDEAGTVHDHGDQTADHDKNTSK